MSSRLISTVFNSYAGAFQYFTQMPLEWNVKLNKYEFDSNIRKLFWWYFNIIVIVGGTGIGSCMYIFVKQLFFQGRVPLLNFIMIFFITVLAFFGIGVALAMVLFGKDFAYGWNNFMAINRRLEREDKLRNPFKKNPLENRTLEEMLKVLTKVLQIYPFLLLTADLIFPIDPYYFVIKDILPPEAPLYLILLTTFIRLTLILISVLEVGRFFPLVTFVSILGSQMFLNILKMTKKNTTTDSKDITALAKLSLVKYISNSLRVYTELKISWQYFRRFQEFTTLLLLGHALGLCVISNYLTITAYNVLPTMIYICFPILSLLNVNVLLTTLPCSIEVYESSGELIRIWKVASGQRMNRHYMQKRLAAVQPLAIYMGFGDNNLFYFKKSTQLTFYGTVVIHTINTILAIPQSVLERAVLI